MRIECDQRALLQPATVMTRTRQDKAGGDEQRRPKMLLFILLLFAVLCLTLVFALRPAAGEANPVTAYVTYVLAGLLAAVVCYGFLASSGWLKGKTHGFDLRVGGALLALVVVAGGGGAYERFGHTPVAYTQRLRFVDRASQPVKLTGLARLFLGNGSWSAELREASDAAFDGVPSAWRGKSVTITLDTAPFVLAAPEEVCNAGPEPIVVRVIRDPNAASYSGTLSSRQRGAWNQAVLQLVGVDCETRTTRTGFFTFRGCGEADRLENPRVRVTLPRMQSPCPGLIPLQRLPKLSALTVEANCSETGSDPAASPKPQRKPQPETRCEFRCSGRECIPASKVCNGVADCSNGRDETSEICGSQDSCCGATNGCAGETGSRCADTCCCCPGGAKCCANPADGCCWEDSGKPMGTSDRMHSSSGAPERR